MDLKGATPVTIKTVRGLECVYDGDRFICVKYRDTLDESDVRFLCKWFSIGKMEDAAAEELRNEGRRDMMKKVKEILNMVFVG